MSVGPFVVDACSALNLVASGLLGELPGAIGMQLLALPEVMDEARYVLGEMDEEGNRKREPIDWSGILAGGQFSMRTFPEEALESFVELSAELTDVDAKYVAFARHLRVGLVSDDGKVRRVFSADAGGLPLRSTVSLIRQAASLIPLDQVRVRDVFARIRERARFEPPRKDPDYEWYVRQVGA